MQANAVTKKRRAGKAAKIAVTLLLSCSLILASVPSEFAGRGIHIGAGCGFLALTAAHIILSRKFFAAALKNFFKIRLKAKLNLTLDFLMLCLCAAIAVSGGFLASGNLSDPEFARLETAHGLLGASLFIAAVIHGCMHLKKRRKKANVTR
jgi:hypothetical protein